MNDPELVESVAGDINKDGVGYKVLSSRFFLAWVRRDSRDGKHGWSCTLYRRLTGQLLGTRLRTKMFRDQEKAWAAARKGLLHLEARVAQAAREEALVRR